MAPFVAPIIGGLALLLASPAAAAFSYPSFTYPDCDHGPLRHNVVCDRSAAPAARAKGLVAVMSQKEKLGNLVNWAAGAPRLGISEYNWWSEALHGIAFSPGTDFSGPGLMVATQFPEAITMSAAFDDDLIVKVGQVIGKEARAFANGGRSGLDFWTPNLNPYRDPRWGRGHETPGEDAFRMQKYAAAFIEGMQRNDGAEDGTYQVVVTCKHYAGYDLENWNNVTRYNFDAEIPMQDLTEYYLPPFEQCARSKVGSIMCSYNSVNGVPACADSYLMGDILRGHWGWTDEHQYITSDCDAFYQAIYLGHKYAPDFDHATGLAYSAGVDTACFYPPLNVSTVTTFQKGLFSEKTMDMMLVRTFQALIKAGYFDGKDSPYRNIGPSDVNTPSAQALALKIAEESIVLVHNKKNMLPLKKDCGPLAMIGFWASDGQEMLGGYSGAPPYTHSAVWAAEQLGLKVHNASGPIAPNSSVTDTWTAPALAAAKKADVIMYFGGIDNTIELETVDRYSIAWPSAQLELIRKLAGLGKPVIVAKMGTHVDDTPLLSMPNVKAIVWTGYPGQDGGKALMNVVTGAVAPAGRFPMTMYPSEYVNQVAMTDMTMRPSASNPGRTYRWYNDAVFPYGHGLHYTSWKTHIGHISSCLSIQALIHECKHESHIDECPLPDIPISVENAGHTESDFVALAFVAGEFGPKPYPVKTLVSFVRLFGVKGGHTEKASLKWNIGNLARRDAKGNLVLYPGTYDILIDQPTGAKATFKLEGEPAVLDQWPQPN